MINITATVTVLTMVLEIFKDGQQKYGPRAWSSMIVKRLEDTSNTPLRTQGFPPEMVDYEPEEKGAEIVVKGRKNVA